MRVVLSAGKRGHYYLAARALREQGVLARFITSTFFPAASWRRRLVAARRIDVRSDGGLDGAPVTSLWGVELAYRAAHLLRCGGPRLTRLYNACFDRASARLLPAGGDTFHVATTYALHSAEAARDAGMRVVIDQQAVHPRYRLDELPRIHKELGLPAPRFDPRIGADIERELALADVVLTPSRFVRDENVRAGLSNARLRIVPIGVDTDRFRPPEPPRRRRGPLQVLFAGRLAYEKGLSVLFDAARAIGPRDIRLTLVGPCDRGVFPLLHRNAGLFRWLGPVVPERLAQAYREADVFCLPSFAEGSALVVYEAMASGLPCVVTPATGSIVRHGQDGWIVPTADADALAEALRRLADEPDLRARLGAAARMAACRNDVAAYGRRLVEAYGPPAPIRRASIDVRRRRHGL